MNICKSLFWHMTALSLAGLAMIAGPALADQAAPAAATCNLYELVSLNMTTKPDGRFSIPATIDGREMHLLVDTGSQVSSISSETARELGLEPRSSGYVGEYFNGLVVNKMVEVESLKLGNLSTKGTMKLVLLPEGMMSPSDAGMLAPDVMQNYDVEFDFFRGKFNLFAPHQCKGVVYWTADNFAAMPMKLDNDWHIMVSANLDGKEVAVILDTGSDSSFMNLDAARDLFGWDEKDPRLKLVTTEQINNGSKAQIYNFPFADLDFEGIAVKYPSIQLIPKEHFWRFDRNSTEIVLGMNVLRQLHIYAAYKEGVLYITAAEAGLPSGGVMPPPATGAPPMSGAK
jgi:clan AA aspartic protease (TIGR02281 family)